MIVKTLRRHAFNQGYYYGIEMAMLQIKRTEGILITPAEARGPIAREAEASFGSDNTGLPNRHLDALGVSWRQGARSGIEDINDMWRANSEPDIDPESLSSLVDQIYSMVLDMAASTNVPNVS